MRGVKSAFLFWQFSLLSVTATGPDQNTRFASTISIVDSDHSQTNNKNTQIVVLTDDAHIDKQLSWALKIANAIKGDNDDDKKNEHMSMSMSMSMSMRVPNRRPTTSAPTRNTAQPVSPSVVTFKPSTKSPVPVSTAPALPSAAPHSPVVTPSSPVISSP
eukprot:CAMPEP_0172422866 /NCGR_PEP_ID=MMETSP1064-20121228/8991_1 /TAXON_ID=202472 /ORGANISM="Aulacoseira subarctica , Strain CCAP 1002/5" /LENGTH=159 /DNA_ID=CAMNT_0013163947 /DNA_START=138 /DNA_END=614 /DNA_ORIENTATION=+